MFLLTFVANLCQVQFCLCIENLSNIFILQDHFSELNGNSSHGDTKNSTCLPTTMTKVEESAHISEETHASITSTGEGSSKEVTSDAPLFGAPISTNSASAASANEVSSSANEAGSTSKLFMFGQNLQDRVLVPITGDPNNESSDSTAKADETTTSVAESSQNATKKMVAGGDLKPTPVFASSSGETLIFKDSAEKTEKKGDGVFSSTMQMQTGEENEITVLQVIQTR